MVVAGVVPFGQSSDIRVTELGEGPRAGRIVEWIATGALNDRVCVGNRIAGNEGRLRAVEVGEHLAEVAVQLSGVRVNFLGVEAGAAGVCHDLLSTRLAVVSIQALLVIFGEEPWRK
jgi:hypothetical protein